MSTELDLGWLDPSLGALTRRDGSGFGTGLSRALAVRLGVDVVLVRVAFVMLGLSAGLGVALYAWGTALTRGPHGTRPVDSVLPSFSSWSSGTQKSFVVISTVVFVACVSVATPLPWGAGALALAAFLLWRRRPAATASAAPHAPDAGASDEELIQAWRARVSRAAAGPSLATRLPEVDLYSPPAATPAPAPPRPKTAWLAGLGILALSAAAGVVAGLVLGVGILIAVSAAVITGGLLSLVFALLVRTRRLPRPLLAVLLVGLVASGWLATVAAQPAANPREILVHEVGGSRTVDLRGVDLDEIDAIRVQAVDAEVEILLPGAVVHSEEDLRWSTLDYGDRAPSTPAVTPDLLVDATFSKITVVERP